MSQSKNSAQFDPFDEDGWETESQESALKVTFDVGDSFTGIKTGTRVVTFDDHGEDKSFTVYQFSALGMKDLNVDDGTLCDVQESFKLKALADIPDGKLVRITRMKDVPVHGRPEPMKDYRIQSRSI